MITKLRNLLGLDSISDKLTRIVNIDSELSDLSSNINDLASEYTSRNESRKLLLKSNVDTDILKSVNDRFNSFESDHLQETISIKKNKDSLEIERKKILSNDTISKAYNDLLSYNKIKEAYKQDIVSSEVFNIFLKAKQGKVKYADNLVFNEEGKLLIIQRAKTDKSNPEKWVLPGGHVDVGEDYQSAAKRELQEESGLVVTECEKVGSYSDDNVSIEYYRSTVDSQEQAVILETEESQDSKWIYPHTELDNFEMVFNMKDNIKKILNISKDNVTVIKKALENGFLDYETFEKAGGHKYISRTGSKGNYQYVYSEDLKKDKEEDSSKLEQAVKKVESELVKLPYEQNVCFNLDGSELFRSTDKEKSSAKIPKEFDGKMKGKVLVHNHPNDDSFSINDIAICLSQEIKQIRVVTTEGMFTLDNKYGSKINLVDHETEINKKYGKWFEENSEDTTKRKEGWVEVFFSLDIIKKNKDKFIYKFIKK